MSKRGKEVMDSSPYAHDEEANTRRKHRTLMQDFLELVKETESMKKRLKMAKERKRILSAEVKFLRQRHKFLTRNRSTIFSADHPIHPQNSRVRLKSSSKERNFKTKELSSRSTSAVLDLNQISNLEVEDRGEFPLGWEDVGVKKKLKWSLIESNVMGSDMKQAVCRNAGNASSRSGKRKISWQDQVALRV